MENIETVVLACSALHNFLHKTSPKSYTPTGSIDCENIIENCVELGERCDHERMHNLQRSMRGQQLESAKIVGENFTKYFNQEGSVAWQEKSISVHQSTTN